MYIIVIHISHRNRKGYLGLQTWYPGSKCIMVADWAALSKKSKINVNHCLWFAGFSLYINDGEVRTAFFKFLNILEPKMNWVVQCWCNELVFLWMILVAAVASHFYILHLSWSCLVFSTWDVPCLVCDVWATSSGISLCPRVLYWDSWSCIWDNNSTMRPQDLCSSISHVQWAYSVCCSLSVVIISS